MLIFLCHPRDTGARAFVAALRRRHTLHARIITPQELVYSADMQHRLDGGDVFSSVTLKNHGTLDSASITGLVNRIDFLPDAHLAQVSAPDRLYIQQELLAIWSSWIAALPCPVINRPSPASMAGPVYHPAVWQHYAAAAGLPVTPVVYDADQPEPVAQAATHSATVCLGQCHSASLPAVYHAACCTLAEFAGLDMAAFHFSDGPDGPVFSLASNVPDLGPPNGALMDQLAGVFATGAT